MAEHTHPEIAARLAAIEVTLDDHTRTLDTHTVALREILRVVRRIDEAVRRPGQNGQQP
ncbi:MAG TPA: hypothetical protein VFB50_03505 [Chloroflexota bacterium]|nr:hypothetical protein [Chloroflexota bacterium]